MIGRVSDLERDIRTAYEAVKAETGATDEQMQLALWICAGRVLDAHGLGEPQRQD